MRFAPSRLIRSKLIVKLTMTIVDRSIKISQAIRNYILVSTTHLSNVIAMNIPTQLKMLQLVRIFLYFDWIRSISVCSPNTGKYGPKTDWQWSDNLIMIFGINGLYHSLTGYKKVIRSDSRAWMNNSEIYAICFIS